MDKFRETQIDDGSGDDCFVVHKVGTDDYCPFGAPSDVGDYDDDWPYCTYNASEVKQFKIKEIPDSEWRDL